MATVWLDGAGPPPKYAITQSNNTVSEWAIFCQGIHPMYILNFGFIDKKNSSKYSKLVKLEPDYVGESIVSGIY
jgi:hypothetical protein